VTIARVSGGGCRVLAHAWDRTVGCAGLDRALYTYLTSPASVSKDKKGKGKEKDKGKDGGGGLFGLVGKARRDRKEKEKEKEGKAEEKGKVTGGGAAGVLAGAGLNPRAR
jgi:hypothetical protein